jgi:hypothetical protein
MNDDSINDDDELLDDEEYSDDDDEFGEFELVDENIIEGCLLTCAARVGQEIEDKERGSCEQCVHSYQLSNELSANAFAVDAVFTHRQIVFQILLVDPAKGAQKITGRRPQTFDTISMNFAHPITVVIARPLTLAMTDRAVSALDSVVAWPLIGVTLGRRLGKPMDVRLQSLPISMFTNSQATLPTVSPDGPHHRWSIILIGAVPAPLVGSAPRWIQRIRVLFAFFPPHSETSRRSQSQRHAGPSGSRSNKHSVGGADATSAQSAARVPVPRPEWSQARLCRNRAVTRRPGTEPACSQRKWSRCRGCTRSDTSGSGNPLTRTLVGGTGAPSGWWPDSPGSAVRGNGNAAAPTARSLVDRVNQLWGRSFPNLNMHTLFT